MKRFPFLFGIIILAVLWGTGCAEIDVVRKYSPESLDALIEAAPEIAAENTAEEHYYHITADGTATLKISRDYALTDEDLVMATALQPFLDAGLDPARLGEGYRVEGDSLLLTADFGKGTGRKDGLTDALFEAVHHDRRALSYHEALDHFGISLPKGKFEWAKDYKTNDKDIVFVIAAKPLADLGVDVRSVEGWAFMAMDEPDGSKVDVLLKPYDVK